MRNFEMPDNTEPTPKPITPESQPNNQIEDSLDVKALSTSMLLQESLEGPELIEGITQKIESNQKLKQRLGLAELDHLELELKIAESVDQLKNMAEGLVMMAELIAIILVNPKGLVKAYKKLGLVLAQNDATLKRIDAELDAMTSDENKLKVAAGYLGKLISFNNPSKRGIAAVTYLSKLVGIVSEEEYAQMEKNTDLIEQPSLNFYIIFETIKNDPALAESIYEIAMATLSDKNEK